MSHNPQWLVNKHPKDLKAQIKELVGKGYTVTLQDAGSAQLVQKKSFSCLFALLTGVIPYALYYMSKRDYTVYLDTETQTPDPNGIIKEPNPSIWLLKAVAIFFGVMFFIIALSSFLADSAPDKNLNPEDLVVDAPHLLGLTIEQARTELGTPDDKQIEPTALQLSIGMDSWTNLFTVKEYSIQLDYSTKTREVTELFIATNDPSGATQNWKELLKITGLSENSNDYSVKPVEVLSKPGYYTGVTATDK